MKFEDIKTELELIGYLDDSSSRLSNRKFIYHYTTIDRCKDIFTSNLWFLSRANCMNDQLEYQNGEKEIWNNLFFASFMSDVDESIGMWRMYSDPWEKGVQIAIPVAEAKKWIKNVQSIKEISCKDFNPTGNEIMCGENCKVFLSSVAYTNCDNNVDGQSKITWSNVSNQNFPNASHIRDLTGYIKDAAWEYEKEIRIKASFNNINNYSKVAIDIPDYVLNSIVLTASPLYKGDLQRDLETVIKRHFETETSLFTGRLQLKNSCEKCERKTK